MNANAPVQPSLDDLLGRIVRDDVRAMGAYHVPDASGMVKLDAMENPTICRPCCATRSASGWPRWR